MKISELSRRTQVPKETIHYYVREGVLPKPRKKGKNLADYGEDHVEQIRIIKSLQDSYYLPLSVIRKIIRQQRKQSPSELSAFHLLREYFRPLDRFLTREITGSQAFREATGLAPVWLEKMEEWGILSPQRSGGEPVYSQDDVIIGKLLVDMDRIGFGPRNGYDPVNLKPIAEFMRNDVRRVQKGYYDANLERLSAEELVEKGTKFTEIMSLFLYHLYRKVVKEELTCLLRSNQTTDDRKGEGEPAL